MNLEHLNRWRIRHRGLIGDNENGAFFLPGPCGMLLGVIASTGHGWEHVSVSGRKRNPNWQEMEWVKKRTLGDVVAMQLHFPEQDHISIHPFCLHIWRPLGIEIPVPPKEFV